MRRKPDLENRAEYVKLADSCDFLEHYHIDHSDDLVTKFTGKLKDRDVSADIYIVSDPTWKKKLAEFTASAMES